MPNDQTTEPKTTTPADTDDTTIDKSGGANNKKIWIMTAIVAVIAALAGWWWYDMQNQSAQPSGSEQSAEGETVAVVNGEEVKRSAYEQILSQTQAALAQQGQGGQAPGAQEQAQSQAMESLISQTLLLQAAEDAGISPNATDIEAQLNQVSGQFPDAAAFESALAQQGITQESLREQISDQLAIQEYLDQELDLEAVSATDAEIQEFYDEISGQSEQVPPLEEIRSQLESSLVQQKQQEQISQLIDELREAGEVEVLL